MNKEKARELAEKINSINPSAHITSAMVLNRLEQNQPEPVVVGLSERQINDIALKFLGVNSRVLCPTVGTYSQSISEYLKTQTFAQSTTLQPNWDDAPVSAIGAALFLDFYDETAKTVKSVVIKRFERPQPPAPTVEVGQVWEHSSNGTSYLIASVGKVKLNDVWIESVTYSSNEYGSFTRTLSDFLAKFVKVE